MNCTSCDEYVSQREADWVMPGWPNRWRTQTSVPFHRECMEVEFMAKGSEGGSGAHESGKSSDGKGKGGYLGKHEADAKDSGKDGKK